MVRKRILVGAALAAALGLSLSACTASGSATGGGDTSTTDTINAELWYAPATFDPAKATGSSDVEVARLGFDTLLRQGEGESGQYIGGLASKWDAESASKYVFTIRDGATCSDGTAITPTVVADSFKYLVGLDDSGAQTWKNQAFGSGVPTFTADDSAKTLTVDLSAPYSQLLGGMTRPGTGIICPAGIKDPKGLAAGTVKGAWSGPYTLTKSAAGKSVAYSLRDDYDAWPAWKTVTGKPAKTINMTVQGDSNTSANLLQSGGVDVARFYDSNAERFTGGDYSTVKFASSAYNLVFNEAEGSGSVFAGDQALRAATAAAVDTKGFNNAGLDGLGVAQHTVNAASYRCAVDDSALVQGHDAAAAAKELKGKTIRLLIVSNWDPAADFLAESLRNAGATVKVTAPDPADWTTQMRTKPETWDLALAAEDAQTGLINTSIARYLGPTYADGGTNVTSSDNPEGLAAYQAAMATSDPAKQCTDFETAQKTILERVDMSPLITDTHRYVARKGFETHVFSGYWDVSAMRIVK
ncbi:MULTISPECIES: ABC transporter substrate-binding protein [unclassified Curtobacterium]|uniref:ABC transporter substrate-binding protein n=1 Tax=unclassified Curtobacterium TaxID=257496 RepID=UPI00226BA2B3|nr:MULTISPECIES: ABC transporter substrate-binding protein [unclassified Curtobacterium]